MSIALFRCFFVSSAVKKSYQVTSTWCHQCSGTAACYSKTTLSSAQSIDSLMANSPSSVITGFGVELELVFAFHEDLLVEVLGKRHLSRDHIIKKIPSKTKNAIGLRHHGDPPLYLHTRPGHRGWVLRIDQAESLKDWQGIDENDHRANVVGVYRTYWTEPLYIVQNILRRLKNYTIDVEISKESYSETGSYSEWKVVNDYSLVPAGKAEMKGSLKDRIHEREVINWDNTGLELVTPIMHRVGNDVEFDEISVYLETLQGDDTSNFGILPSKYGAVHVHIGFAESIYTLLILQHLAFIMLQYELLLIKLFPFHRNGSHMKNFFSGLCKEDTRSNKDQARMYEFGRNPVSRPTMDDLGRRVFSTRSCEELCVIMQFNGSVQQPDYGTKGYLVNFINLAEAEKDLDGAKRTVEFRHHESTVDPNAIKMWVKLLLKICHTAEGIARSELVIGDQTGFSEDRSPPEEERLKYKSRPANMEHIHPLEDLFELVGLTDDESLGIRDRELRNYWQSRYDQHRHATEGLQPSPDFPDSPTQAVMAETYDGDRHAPSNDEGYDDDEHISTEDVHASRPRSRRRETGSRPLRRVTGAPSGRRMKKLAGKSSQRRLPKNKILASRVLRSGKKL